MLCIEIIKIINNFSESGFVINTLILFSVPLVFYLAYKRITKIRLVNRIPGPKSFPIIGNSLRLLGSDSEKFKTITGFFCSYGDAITRIWIGLNPWCYIYRADAVEQLLKGNTHLVKPLSSVSNPWIGKSLIGSSGTGWHQRRKMLTPAFNMDVFGTLIDVFNKHCDKCVRILEPKANGLPFDLYDDITYCILNGLLESVVGRTINTTEHSIKEYAKALITIQQLIFKRKAFSWLQNEYIFKFFGYKKLQDQAIAIINRVSDVAIHLRSKELHLKNERHLKNEIIASEKTNAQETKTRTFFLDAILKSSERKTITDMDITQEVNGLMAAGHETSTNLILWSLYLLGVYKESQDIAVKEIDDIFGESDRFATMEDLQEMEYLECCLKESLRIFPSVPWIGRILNEDMAIDGYTVPAGTLVWINIFRLHRDPKEFPEPEVFKPERFFRENCANRRPYAYIPFGGGPRICIGNKLALIEAKIFLSSFLRKYGVESTIPMESLKLVREGFILSQENKNIVRLFKRM